MRFIVDECTGPSVAQWLQSKGFEVFSMYEQNPGKPDLWILDKANSENWIIITNDKGLGEMIFHKKVPHHGLILLRLTDERNQNKIAVLEFLLMKYKCEVADRYIVISETAIRIV